MIFLGTFKAGASVFYVGNFHTDQGTLENPTSPEAQIRTPAGVWSALTTPAIQNAKAGHFGGAIDTTGFAVGQYTVRLAGTVSTAKTTATEFCFEIVAYDPADAVDLGLSSLDAAISSRMATFTYTAPDNAGILAAIAGIPAAVWASVSRTLTSFGSIASDVWAYAARTLTQSAAQVSAIVSGSDITALRGDDVTIALTGLGSLTGRTKLWFTVKEHKGKSDAESSLQIMETTGLTYLGGVAAGAAPLPLAAWGAVVVDDAALGNVTVTIKAAAMALLSESKMPYDIQMLTASGVFTKTTGTFGVTNDVTKAVS
jgi:hypothetical protein